MTTAVPRAFSQDFEANASSLPGTVEARAEAWEIFSASGLPTPADEDWRFASLKAIGAGHWTPATPGTQDRAPLSELALAAAQRLVLLDGLYDASASTGGGSTGATLRPLSESLKDGNLAGLGAMADLKTHSLIALNRALFRDGAELAIAPGCSLEEPIFLVNQWGHDSESHSVQVRNVIRVGAGSRAVVVELLSSSAPTAKPVFANLVTEIELEANARLDYITLQVAGPQDQVVSSVFVGQGSGSRLGAHSLALGAGMHRSEVRSVLAGEGSHCELNGLYLGRGQQKLDHYTTIDHATPHTTSDELYKGILADRSHGVFHGRIQVRPHAQKIQALQHNANLLLSDRARINSKPQLEIYADDVRCTHGATIGQLDPDHLFFLRARGIPEQEAVGLLTYGFASEILSRLPAPAIQAHVGREILNWLGAEAK